MSSKTDVPNAGTSDTCIMRMQLDTFCMVLHLSQLIPYVGPVVSIILWATNRHKNKLIDRHGKTILNWLLSCFIYAVWLFVIFCVAVFCLFFAGIIFDGNIDSGVASAGWVLIWVITVPPLFILIILNISFPIIGAIRSMKGVVWRYPLSITFINTK